VTGHLQACTECWVTTVCSKWPAEHAPVVCLIRHGTSCTTLFFEILSTYDVP
jgi:hypothetical protein